MGLTGTGRPEKTVTAMSLIDAGYTNEFLFTLLPEAIHKRPTVDDLYAEKDGDSALVKAMKQRAREGAKKPMPLDQLGNRPTPRAKVHSRHDDLPNNAARPQPTQRVGEGRELLGPGAPAAGGYDVNAVRPRGIMR
jgi:hypothetical protein